MRITKAEFVTSVANLMNFKNFEMPEVTFVGRSNVGKSSLINALTNQKKLAKTSSTAGRTRLVNFFMINNRYMLVDLPGYGYAKAGKEAQQQWQTLIEGYLQKSQQLKIVFVLVDIRIKPTELDKQMLNYLYYYNIHFKVLATKSDKIAKSQVNNRIHNIAVELGLGKDDIIPVSVTTKMGIEEVLEYISRIIDYDNLQVINYNNLNELSNNFSKDSVNNKINIKPKDNNKNLELKNIKNKNNEQNINKTTNKKNLVNKRKIKDSENKNDKKNIVSEKKTKKTPRYVIKKRKGK